MLTANNLLASWITDGANAYETINKTIHWSAYLAAAIAIVTIKATWNMQPLPNKFASNARASAIYLGVGMSGGYALYEFGPKIVNITKGLWNIILGLIDIIRALF